MLIFREWKGKPERRSYAFRTLDADFAPVLLNDGPADMQPESQTHTKASLSFDPLYPVKPLPDALLFHRQESRPLITYRDTRYLSLFHQSNFDRAVRRRVFQGVIQIVDDNLPNTLGIRENRHRFFCRQYCMDNARRCGASQILDCLTYNC